MPTALRFYRDALGFVVVSQSGSGDDVDWVLLRLDDVELMLNTAYDRDKRPPTPDQERIATHEDTVLYFGCPDVDAAHAHLRAAGLEVKAPAVAWYGLKQLYLTDPDGYSICYQWPAEGTQAESSSARSADSAGVRLGHGIRLAKNTRRRVADADITLQRSCAKSSVYEYWP